ncbi:MAG: hypothetical protein HW407_1402 [Bacteroidetes bacterium]|nr:hypothetical protein [Bacteroidota bacterium]
MSRVKTGLIAGLVFGILDIIPMMFMDLPDRNIAMIGAFLNRFAIGFLIPNTTLPLPGWLTGLSVALLLSLPDAIITGAYAPILVLGMVGGVVIGFVVNRKRV